jgi:hypothetical protein
MTFAMQTLSFMQMCICTNYDQKINYSIHPAPAFLENIKVPLIVPDNGIKLSEMDLGG